MLDLLVTFFYHTKDCSDIIVSLGLRKILKKYIIRKKIFILNESVY